MINVASAETAAPLTEYNKEEWWEVCQEVAPHISRERFEIMWADFAEKKGAGYFEHGVH